MNIDKILDAIASKWFVLILAIVMLGVLPITYSNLVIVFDAGEMSRLWYIPTVFICNLLAAMMASYKGASMFFKKKEHQEEEWEDED